MSNDPTNAERQARHRAKQRKARAALEAELRALRDERAAQAQAFRDGWKRRAAKPKAEKPPLPPDEARDRRIKALTTETRNLRAQVRYMREHSRDGAGNMTRRQGRPTADVGHSPRGALARTRARLAA